MRNVIIAAMLLLTACGESSEDATANTTMAIGNRVEPETTVAMPEPPKYPLPTGLPTGLLNPSAKPEIAAHIARQERCAHWRQEQEGGAVRPEVTQGLTRECKGIDAELEGLRKRFDSDGPSINLLRPFSRVEG